MLNEEIFNKSNTDSVEIENEIKIEEIEDVDLEEKINDKLYQTAEVSEAENQIDNHNLSNDLLSSSPVTEKSDDTSVRRLSLFDTLSTENKSESNSLENNVHIKTEPIISSSDEHIENNVSEDNKLEMSEKEEFSPEETEPSEIDEEFNQETDEELLDIPTFLRRQAN